MKKYILLATALAALVSCSENEFVGDENITNTSQNEQGAIAFGTGLKAVTRGDKTGADAADLLKKNFVVYGYKWNGNDTKEEVFDHYNVNWKENTANTTTSNTKNWEYVAQTKHAFGPSGGQSIKYWDYSKTQYDFIAYSAGKDNTAVFAAGGYDKESNVYITEITPATMTSSTGGAYTIKGKAANLAKVYIADLVSAYRDLSTTNDAAGDYQKDVTLKFRSLSAKVRIALYEIVPGYSVKNVKFYQDASTALLDEATEGNAAKNNAAKLYTTGSDVFNEEGTYTVYFPTTGHTASPNGSSPNTDYNKAHLSFVAETSGTSGTSNLKTFGVLSNFAGKEVSETAESIYLGRSSNAATYAGTADPYYSVVLPNETGAVLNLLVDYDLVSTDGSGETIHVTKASAKVPKEYATWKSGYAYTYLFKISQNGNGWTNPSAGPAGLYPITFDAVVVNDEVDNIQETITTVAEPSITTYAKGKIVTENDEYLTGNNIYVVVNKDGSNVTLAEESAKLYTVTIEAGAAQTINEASVANALVNGQKDNETIPTQWTVTDALGKKMIVKTASGLTFPGKIAAADAPDGNEITVNCAKFTPAVPSYATQTPAGENPSEEGLYERSGDAEPYVYTITTDTSVDSGKTYYKKTSAAGIYVFEYTYDTDKKAYKIIKIVDK